MIFDEAYDWKNEGWKERSDGRPDREAAPVENITLMAYYVPMKPILEYWPMPQYEPRPNQVTLLHHGNGSLVAVYVQFVRQN